MSKGISARNESVDFDLLLIKQQLSTTPLRVGVNERRSFIDAKEGVKRPKVVQQQALHVETTSEDAVSLDDLLASSMSAAQQSSKSKK